jgi:predicted transcriptional regulator
MRGFRLSDEEWAQVVQLAQAQGVAASEIVRRAVAEYVKRQRSGKRS